MKVALYCRVSTSDQTCASQLAELQDYCLKRDWSIVERYVESASGAKSDRPELSRLIANVRVRRFDIVLCWKVDRFGRSVTDVLRQLEILKAAGIRFIASSQGIDTGESSATANLLLNMLAAVAEFEREMIRERQRAGIDAAKRAGKTFGRPRRVVDVVKIADMRAQGLSFHEVAKRLGVSARTVRRAWGKISIIGTLVTSQNPLVVNGVQAGTA